MAFAGNVAGNLSVTVGHDEGVRTTYSYLSALAVATGQPVLGGQVIGWSGAGHPGSGLPPHIHLSARRGDVYFDPLSLYVGNSHADLLSLTR